MKYTYKHTVEGIDRSSHYLVFNFDKVLSSEYRSALSFEQAPESIQKLITSISQTKGVIPIIPNSFSGAGLIAISGNTATVKISALDVDEIRNTAYSIVKKVQRRFANGESRKRVNINDVSVAVNSIHS